MKPFARVLALAFLSLTAGFAFAEDPPARITFGQSTRADATSRVHSFLFPVSLTNTSARPLTYDAVGSLVFHGASARPNDASPWRDAGHGGLCAVSAETLSLEPGATVTFRIRVSPRLAGQQLRVSVTVRDEASGAKFRIESAPTPIE